MSKTLPAAVLLFRLYTLWAAVGVGATAARELNCSKTYRRVRCMLRTGERVRMLCRKSVSCVTGLCPAWRTVADPAHSALHALRVMDLAPPFATGLHSLRPTALHVARCASSLYRSTQRRSYLPDVLPLVG